MLLKLLHLFDCHLLLNLVELQGHGDIFLIAERQNSLQFISLGEHGLLDERPFLMEDHVLHLEQEVPQKHDYHHHGQDSPRNCLECVVASKVNRNGLSELVLVLDGFVHLF